MYSNLVKADYEIKDMNLKELREILVKQNNLTPLDILKGFHEKSKICLEYPSCITEENMKDIKLIQEECKSYLLNNGRELVQKVYDEKFDSLLDDYQKEDADITIENIYHNINDERFNTMSVHTWNKISCFLRELSRISVNLKSSVKKLTMEYITSWTKEKFGDKYKIIDTYFSRFEELPYELNVNKEINIDFTKVYETAETKYNEWDTSTEVDDPPKIAGRYTKEYHKLLEAILNSEGEKQAELLDYAFDIIQMDKKSAEKLF